MNQLARRTRRILLIGMVDSVHVARWLKSTLATSQLEVMLLPTSPHRRVHPEILALIANSPASGSNLRIHPLLRYLSILIWLFDRPFLFGGHVRSLFIGHAIRSFQPELVHIMETQNGGYPYLAYAERSPHVEPERRYRLVLTLFGSDLFWFSKFSYHERLLSRLLPKLDILAAECDRDVVLAHQLGFAGKVARLSPVSGGLDPLQIAREDSDTEFATRDVIAIKGYGGTWGLGHQAIEALAKVPEMLVGKRIVIFSAERAARKAAQQYLRPLGVSYTVYPKFALPHSAMLALYRQSLLYVGMSRSDGLPASMLEAMSQGAFPVQTASACIEGWFTPNKSGLLVDVESIPTVGQRVSQVLSDPNFLRQAQSINLETIKARYSRSTVSKQLTYEELLEL